MRFLRKYNPTRLVIRCKHVDDFQHKRKFEFCDVASYHIGPLRRKITIVHVDGKKTHLNFQTPIEILHSETPKLRWSDVFRIFRRRVVVKSPDSPPENAKTLVDQ